jgi:FkbM family methyltransferase
MIRRTWHLVAALAYAMTCRLTASPVSRRLAQYHRAKALPDWAVAVKRFGHSDEKPVLSVVIPSFDYARHLPNALTSASAALSAHGPARSEILIVDDRSTDGSYETACELARASALPVTVIRPLWNVGVSRARNIGTEYARGEFVFFLDADNKVDPEGLAALCRRAKADAADAAYGPIRRVGSDGEELGLVSHLPFDPEHLKKWGNYIDAMALFRRSALVTLGGYDVELLRIIGGWEDYELWLRLAREKCRVSFCPAPTIGTYLVKDDSMVQRISLREQSAAAKHLGILQNLQTTRKERLVFDLGFHLGEDTASYLSAGYDVVAVEADPELHRLGKETFSEAIAAGRLTLIHAAAVGHDRRRRSPMIDFHPHPTRSLWGTVDPEFVERNEKLHALPHATAVPVPTISLEELVKSYGCPFFLKIDIEGMDAEVASDLCRLALQPEFVSWETGKRSLLRVLKTHFELHRIGFSRFRIVQQMYNHHLPMVPPVDGAGNFPLHSSGPTPDIRHSRWQGLGTVMMAYAVLFLVYRMIGPGSPFVRAERSSSALVHTIPRRIRRLADRYDIPFPGWVDSHAALRRD